MSTSNCMIFQGVEYYKTGNATNTLDCFPINACICFVFLLFSINIDTNFDAVTVAPDKVVFFLKSLGSFNMACLFTIQL